MKKKILIHIKILIKNVSISKTENKKNIRISLKTSFPYAIVLYLHNPCIKSAFQIRCEG